MGRWDRPLVGWERSPFRVAPEREGRHWRARVLFSMGEEHRVVYRGELPARTWSEAWREGRAAKIRVAAEDRWRG